MQKTQKASLVRYYLFLAAALIWMAVIFLKSAETYQVQTLRPLLSHWFDEAKLKSSLPHWEFTYDQDAVSWQDPIGLIEFFIRKAGHVSEFALLALLWYFTFLTRRMKTGMAMLASSVISVVYAVTDEWHQTFVPGRTGHAIDVVVDSIGVVVIVLIILIRRMTKS